MLNEYLEAKAVVDAFDLKSEAWDIGWPAAEKKLKALQQRRDDLAGVAPFIPVSNHILHIPEA